MGMLMVHACCSRVLVVVSCAGLCMLLTRVSGPYALVDSVAHLHVSLFVLWPCALVVAPSFVLVPGVGCLVRVYAAVRVLGACYVCAVLLRCPSPAIDHIMPRTFPGALASSSWPRFRWCGRVSSGCMRGASICCRLALCSHVGRTSRGNCLPTCRIWPDVCTRCMHRLAVPGRTPPRPAFLVMVRCCLRRVAAVWSICCGVGKSSCIRVACACVPPAGCNLPLHMLGVSSRWLLMSRSCVRLRAWHVVLFVESTARLPCLFPVVPWCVGLVLAVPWFACCHGGVPIF